MTEQEIEQYFIYHNENIKLLKIGFDNIREQIKNLYKTKDKNGLHIYSVVDTSKEKIEIRKVEKALSRILSGIQVSWAEESIKRLLYEKNLFTDRQREYLLKRPALDQRWFSTLKIVFSIAYNLVTSDETYENIEIEKEYSIKGGHSKLAPRIDILVKDEKGNPFFFIEAKAPDKFEKDKVDNYLCFSD